MASGCGGRDTTLHSLSSVDTTLHSWSYDLSVMNTDSARLTMCVCVCARACA